MAEHEIVKRAFLNKTPAREDFFVLSVSNIVDVLPGQVIEASQVQDLFDGATVGNLFSYDEGEVQKFVYLREIPKAQAAVKANELQYNAKVSKRFFNEMMKNLQDNTKVQVNPQRL